MESTPAVRMTEGHANVASSPFRLIGHRPSCPKFGGISGLCSGHHRNDADDPRETLCLKGIEISSRRHLQRLAREPSGAPCIDGVKRGAVQARHVGPNFLAGADQRVGKMAISIRVTCEQFAVEL